MTRAERNLVIGLAGGSALFAAALALTNLERPGAECAAVQGEPWKHYGTQRWHSAHRALQQTARCRANN